jgi:hypothetical protein
MTTAREPFDWLLDDWTHRRGNLRTICLAIRRGWLAGPDHAEHRAALSAALCRAARDFNLTARGAIALVKIQLEFDEQRG